jgi:murein DD-endopeptidase MepM/ murein hydrolase activator NlpD
VHSPFPYLISRYLPLHFSTFRSFRIATAIALPLLFLGLNISSAVAQTRARRTKNEPEKSSQRADDKKRGSRVEDNKRTNTVEDKKRASRVETARRENTMSPVLNPLTRKTALTYAPKAGGQSTNRPVLVNDIMIVSRVSDKPTAPLLTTSSPRASANMSADIPSIWPVMGTLRSGVGMRNNPFGGSNTEYHKGQDISAPMGTPVRATATGTVTIARWLRGYGWAVYIDHGNGITTRYGHLSRIDVVEGQTIKRGEQLGLVGSTGRSTGPHLHYEVRINGQPVSPLQYLPPVTGPVSSQ